MTSSLFFVFLSIFALLTLFSLPIGLASVRLALKDFLKSSDKKGSFYMLSPVVGMAILAVVISILLGAGLQMGVIAAVVSVLCVIAIIFLIISLEKTDWQELLKAFLPVLLIFLLVYLVYFAPLIVVGHVGITGYNVANDSVMHTVMGEYLGDHGLFPPKSTANSYNEVAWKIIFKAGYPLGFHEILGFAYTFLGMRAFKLYNAVMAYLAALTVFVVFFILRRFELSPKYSYLGAFLVAIAYLHLGYLVQGFAPQVSALAFIYLSLILLYLLLTERGGLVLTILAAIAVTTSFLFYSFISLVWIFPFIAFLVAYILWDRKGSMAAVKESSLKLLGLVVFSIIFGSSALLLGKQYFFQLIGAVRQQAQVLGNLPGGFVSFLTLFNVWFAPDYRYDVPTTALKSVNYALSLIAVVLFAIGLTYLRRRRIALPFLMLLSWFLPLLTLQILDKPYAHGKVLHMGTLLFSAVIFCGVATLVGYISSSLTTPNLWRILSGLVLLGVILLYMGGFAASDYLALRGAAPSPKEKFADLERFNEELRGRGRPTLFVEREDWGAYFLKDLDASSPLDQCYFGRPVRLKPGYTRWTINGFNSFEYEDVARFNLLIFSKMNDVALVPPNYGLIYRDPYYSVYEKRKEFSEQVVKHLSFVENGQRSAHLSVNPKSSAAVDLSTAQGEAIILSIFVDGETEIEVERWNLKGNSWYVWPANQDYIVNTGVPGASCSGTFTVPEEGTYEIYTTSIPNNGLEVIIDERTLGTIKKSGDLEQDVYHGRLLLKGGQHKAVLVNKGSGDVNYVSRIRIVRVKKKGEPVIIKVGEREWREVANFQPEVRQIVLSGSMNTGKNNLLEIYNPANYPIKVQWVEILKSPYAEGYLQEFNRRVKARRVS